MRRRMSTFDDKNGKTKDTEDPDLQVEVQHQKQGTIVAADLETKPNRTNLQKRNQSKSRYLYFCCNKCNRGSVKYRFTAPRKTFIRID